MNNISWSLQGKVAQHGNCVFYARLIIPVLMVGFMKVLHSDGVSNIYVLC